jgi:oligopeptide/dipeptide ABC transporter ATP-binding protein
MTALASVSGLTKHFDSQRGRVVAVDDVSFELTAGETVGLVGESGCGKSTVGRCLVRLLRPDAGTIRFDGKEIQNLDHRELRRLRRRIQMVFQDPLGSVNPAFTVERTLFDAVRRLDLNREARRRRILELLEQVHLDERHLARRPRELSGGQLQRVGIARALASRPDLLFLDEPTSSLDVSVRGQIVNLLTELQERSGLTYLFASHDLGVIRFIAHRVIVMYLGRIVETGPAEAIFEEPAHPYTKALLIAAGFRDASARDREALRRELDAGGATASGCRYADRCGFVHARCSAEPSLLGVSPIHSTRCWLVEGIHAPAGELAKGTDVVKSDLRR